MPSSSSSSSSSSESFSDMCEVDLDLEGLIETEEEFPGAYLCVGGRRKKLTLDATCTTGSVLLDRSNTKIQVFTAETDGTRIKFNGTDNRFAVGDLPLDLYVEAWYPGEGLRDTTLTLSHPNADEPDTIVFTLIRIFITKIWSDQLPGVDCNYWPGGTGQSNAPNWIMMGKRGNGLAFVKANLWYTPSVPQVQPYIRASLALPAEDGVRAKPIGTATMTWPATQVWGTASMVAAENLLADKFYSVVAGFDEDKRGPLTQQEVCVEVADRVKIINRGNYVDAHDRLVAALLALANTRQYPITRDLTWCFITRIKPGFATRQVATTIDATDQRLSHRTGLRYFSTGPGKGRGATFRYLFNRGYVPDKIVKSKTFADYLKGVIDQKKSEIDTYFTNNPSASSHEFLFDVNGAFRFHPPSDLGFAFGNVKILGTLAVRVQRDDLEILAASFNGTIQDLFDFNYTQTGFWVRDGAVLQAGYPTLGRSGRVFEIQVGLRNRTVSRLTGQQVRP